MGIFDFFKKNKTNKRVASKQKDESKSSNSSTSTAATGQYTGDLDKTAILAELFKTPQDDRDDAWVNQFYEAAIDASFKCDTPQVIQGPDGFPYVKLGLPQPGQEFQCYVIKHMINDFLLEQGFGVVIFTDSQQPEWVFSHGDIVNYHLYSSFSGGSDIFTSERYDKDLQADDKVMMGPPSEQILPLATRKVIGNFLTRYYNDPKVSMIFHDDSKSYELAFNCTPDKFEDMETFRETLQQIGWFLPRYYAYCAIDEEDNEQFCSLA